MAIDIRSMIKPASVASQYLKLLIYGDYGCGKTTLAAMAPHPLIMNHERGITSLLKNEKLRETPTLTIKTLAEYVSLFEFLRSPDGSQFETIVVDTMSELQKIFLDEIITQESKLNSNLDGYTVPNGGYNKNTQKMRALLAQLVELNKHIVILCHVKQTEADGLIIKSPLLSPSVADGFMGLMDVVGYMSVTTDDITKEVTRTIQTLPSKRIEAKNRLDVPDLMVNPKITDFMDSLNKLRNLPSTAQTPLKLNL